MKRFNLALVCFRGNIVKPPQISHFIFCPTVVSIMADKRDAECAAVTDELHKPGAGAACAEPAAASPQAPRPKHRHSYGQAFVVYVFKPGCVTLNCLHQTNIASVVRFRVHVDL